MKKLIAPPAFMMAILALLFAGQGAAASEAVGWITLLDDENDQIVLDSGRTFSLSNEISLSSLADRKHVRVTYETIDGIPTVTGIVLVPAGAFQAESPTLDSPVPVCANMPAPVQKGNDAEPVRLLC